MKAVAEVLARTGALQQEIDRAAERLRGLSNNSVFLTGLARAVAALGSALDWHCAREITRPCTPVAAPPLHRLGAMSDLSLDAIHESTLAAAPQWRDLAARFPEAHFLEASEHTVAVAFGDLDSAASVTTFVAGTGSSEAAGWPAQLERGRTIAQATGGAAVVWLGYRAPGTLPQAVAVPPPPRPVRRRCGAFNGTSPRAIPPSGGWYWAIATVLWWWAARPPRGCWRTPWSSWVLPACPWGMPRSSGCTAPGPDRGDRCTP